MRKLFFILTVSLCGLGVVMAQTALDPSKYVNIQIAGDTLSDGTHDPAKTVYTAQSGQIYAFDGTLFVNFPLTIIGSNNTWLYNQATPPVIVQIPGTSVANSATRTLLNLRAGGSITIKNILMSAAVGDGAHLQTMIENAAGDYIIADNCVFTDHDSHAIKVTGAAQKVHVTNCLFINGIRYRFSTSGGMPHRFDGAIPDLLLENNTSVNMSREYGNGGEKVTSNLIENHYTYVNMQTTGHENHWYSALQANSIFYNWCWYGRKLTTNNYETYFTTFETHLNVKDRLDSISLYNGYNLFYLDPKFTDSYKNELGDSIYQCKLWNVDVDSTILADNDFTIGKNYWQINPMFTTPPNNTDSMLAWTKAWWSNPRPADAPNWAVTQPITYDNNGQPVLSWPPPFNLTYTNNTLLTAGSDKLPLGDLNWFPTQKATYLANRATYIAELQDLMLHATNVYIPGDSASALMSYPPTIIVDAQKDAFFNSLTGPADGYLQIRSSAYNQNGAPKNDADLSAKVWAAWDPTWFYLYEEVMDDTLKGTASNAYQNDGLELKFDPQPKDSVANSIWATALTALGGGTTGTGGGATVAVDSLNNVAASDKMWARRIIPGGYALELAIKWQAIKSSNNEVVSVAVDSVFGLAINDHDNDATTREASVMWAAVMDDRVWNTPKMLGTVKFLANNKLNFIAKNNMTGVTNPYKYNGTDVPNAVKQVGTMIPEQYGLSQNYPNPFNPNTTIEFGLPEQSKVTLNVFNIIGQKVLELQSNYAAGNHSYNFDATKLSSGVYIYSVKATGASGKNFVQSKKMILLK